MIQSWMIPATAIRPSKTRIMTAVAGRTAAMVGRKNAGAPLGGPGYMKEGLVTVGRAGRLSVHTLDERALGMRGTKPILPACTRDIGHGE